MRSPFRFLFAALAVLAIALPSVAAAETVIRVRDFQTGTETIHTLPSRGTAERSATLGLATLATKADEPSDLLLVPYYEVDTTSAGGTTTLFAVRNITAAPITVRATYVRSDATGLAAEDHVLAAGATFTRNVRDVAGGLPIDPDGFARGYIVVNVISDAGLIVGDYFQVDVDGNFATGDRLFSLFDLCDQAEIRFVDLGEPTLLHILVNSALGDDIMTDPPSFSVTVINESGTALGTFDVYTSEVQLTIPSDFFTLTSFGTFDFDFTNGGGGIAFASYTADGKFSIGMNSACTLH